jgi:hypothetical protein
LKTFIITVVATIIAGLVVYYVSMEKPDVIYAITEPITIQEKDSKIDLQQLEVKNVGKTEAQKIRVLIKVPIISYELFKYSKADVVDVFESTDSIELVYSELPSQGSFKLISKSKFGISKELLNISHKGGVAKNALEKRGVSLQSIIFYGIILFYLILTGYGLKSTFIDSWESKSSYSYDEILMRTIRPFYINAAKWDSIRKKALESMVNKSTREDLGGLKFLSSDKPRYLSDEEWELFLMEVAHSFRNRVSSMATETWRSSELIKLLKITKPIHFLEDEWIKLREKISKSYVSLRKAELRRYSEVLDALKSPKPEGLSDEFWEELQEFSRKEFITKILQDIEWKDNPIKYIEELPLDILKPKEKEDLRKKAYTLELKSLPDVLNPEVARKFLDSPKPEWMSTPDYEKVSSLAKKAWELNNLIDKYNGLFSILNSIVNLKPVREQKPTIISDADWEILNRMDRELRVLRKENQRRELELNKEKENVMGLKEKVERQLSIIHIFLTDPSVLDRIEEYSNAFAPGNLENLKKLAKLKKALEKG